MDTDDRERLINQHRGRLEHRETDDLENIWREHDRSEWTDEAFEAISRILTDRVGGVPMLNEQAAKSSDGSADSDENTALWHSPDKLIRVATYARILSWVNVAASIVYAVLLLIDHLSTFGSFDSVAIGFAFMSGVLNVIQSLFPFVVLQAIAEGIYLFMDIEANTRSKAA